jgi:hypothetical protein
VDKKMRTIRALLAKAESTDHPAEAEALRAKAFELMQRYSIDEAMLGAKHESSDVIGQRRIVINEWVKPKGILLAGIVSAFGGKVIKLSHLCSYGTMVCVVYGWESDLQMIEVLFASLEIQAMREMKAARAARSGGNGQAFTRSFLAGFAGVVADRLKQARRHQVAETPGTGTELVLADRSKAVEAHSRQANPTVRKSRPATVSASGGYFAGQAAGQRADLGGGRLAGQRVAIQ